MKKFLFTLTLMMLTTAAWAANYTGTLTVDGTVVSTSATASIDGTTITINDVPNYGSISLVGASTSEVAGAVTNDVTALTGSGTVSGQPATFVAAYKAKDLSYSYSKKVNGTGSVTSSSGSNTIHTSAMFVSVNVKDGSVITFNANTVGYQLLNGDFENWPQGTSEKEPRYWHSFQSANGGLVSSAGVHLTSSTDKRPGSTGSYSADVFSTVVKIIVSIPANGTMTTGRLNAGNASAANVKNHAHSYINCDTVDYNSDPFFMPMVGRPDNLRTWVKHTQAGTLKDKDNPYAKVKAVITDGTYYQDPARNNMVWNNVLAEAENATIQKDQGWQELTIPFNYSGNVEGKTIMITAATNIKPGNGSTTGNDHLYLDDMSVEYKGTMSGISIKGTALDGFNAATRNYNLNVDDIDYTLSVDDITVTKGEGAYAYVIKDVVRTDDGYTVTAAVASNDLASSTQVYTIYVNVPKPMATATLYVYSPVEAPAVDGTTLTETVTGQHVTWYKYEVTDVETAFPKTLAVTAGNGQQDVELAADATVYLSMADGMVDEGYNPFAGNEFTIWVRNMDNEMVAPHLYAWDQVGNKVAGEWPGTELTEGETLDDGFKWFRYTLNDVEKAQFIFSLNGNNQTDNLVSTEEEVFYFYYPGRENQADRAELTERPVAPATSTLYVYSPEEAPVINGEIALSETVTGEHVMWYKYELTDKVTAFPMHITVTAGNGQQDVELAADATVYLSMADGMVDEGYNPFAGNEFTIWVRNMDDENMAPTFYAWDQVGNKVAGEWSGTQLSESEILEDTHIWWRYVLTDVEKAQFIFSLDGNSQSDNLESTAPEAFFYYYPSRGNQSERAELTERPVAPATSTLYVYSPEEAPVINGEIALSETVTGEHVMWYKYELTDKVTAFPMHITVTAGNDQQDVDLPPHEVVYLSMAHGMVGEDFNPFAGNEFTIWVRNMDDDNVAPTFYAWDQVGTEMAGEWSGTQLSESEILADAHRWYKTTLIDVEKAQFIFSLNGDCQSDNLESTDPEAFFYYYPSRDNQSERVERIDVVPEVATVTVAELVANEGTVDNPEETLVDSEITIYERWSEVFGGATLWHMSAFDGEGNWLDVTTTDGDNLPEIGTKYLARSFRASVFTYGMSTQQDVNLVLMLDQADVQLIEVETGEPLSALQTYRLYSMTSDDVPVLNQTIVLMGYYNANDGALRAFSPNNGPQGMGVKLFGNHNLVDGKRYAITGVLYDRYSHDYVLPENAPIHLNAIDDEQYQGIGKIQLFGLAMSQSVEPTVTAIDNLNGVAVVREISGIYNVRGQRVDDITEPGVYIIRYTDGSAIKVRK